VQDFDSNSLKNRELAFYNYKSMKIIFYLLPVFIGVAMSIQSGINAQLHSGLNHPLLAAFLSFLGGLLILGILLLVLRQPFPQMVNFSEIKWYNYTGGLLGAFVVYAVIISVHRIGASNMFVLIVAGQLITAVIMDHFSMLGLKESPISMQKLLGILLVIAGAFLVNKK
jgi:bacterial/archaeal transporter family-2 protein